ncbi:glycoside hydrolase family 30 beta sandwich domain-containing protein [Zunongwangia sp. F363]|uniref:Glycoside hydrolase family 30 beta sandwich domain-containing protein n=1 Tax=Autumnicola tepida TaxID=3075595 RepID=A0ABU3C907_9FLAO|nr:glycoside hydrolase family 30 beta sandwich domain-containing protein [Zunongwangia sp. F363]MDT0642781.1 glycoside hydrolase family 30 beta sandwich domain-containing protein [Zunongwangia sp. F363]
MQIRLKKYVILAAGLGILSLSCSGDDEPTYEPPAPPAPVGEVVGQAKIWTTTGTGSKLLGRQDDVDIYDSTEGENPSITVDASQQYQEIEGFGAALTGSSAYVINRMDANQKNALLTDLFDPETGIGLSYLRLTMGASDFSLSDFTYNDVPQGQQDPDLSEFSIAEDEKHVIPVLKDILQISSDVGIMASPWSAPAWMKTSQSLYGGSLEERWYDTYADYFVKYIDAYASQGIEVNAVTPQNEPLHEAGYPTMKMEAAAQASFIKNSLGPTFEEQGINTKIIAYDHNFDEPGYPIAVLSDEEAYEYVDGVAFHAYAGNVSAMGEVHEAFPDKGLYFTEVSGGEWATGFAENLKWNMRNILIGTTKNWSKTALFWNLALNESFGPTNNGCEDCRGVVTVSGSGEIDKNVEYYSLAHFSKFIRPGAHRISSTEFDSSTGLQSVAFQNTDGSLVLVVLNDSGSTKSFSVINEEESFSSSLEANSVQTIVWE